MAQELAQIDEALATWIRAQHLFFVASAPADRDGLVNCSPKGLDTLAILGPRRVAYLDLTGSGVETIAHLRENGRIVLMFCAFEGSPQIVRLHGHGEVLAPDTQVFDALRARFPDYPGVRSIIQVDVRRIAKSCGFGVPRYTYEGERDQMIRFADAKGEDGIAEYQASHNAKSLDGLPGLPSGNTA